MRPPKTLHRPATSSVGYWAAALAAGYALVNAVRATANPVAFADYLGLPIAEAADSGFVYVYAVRSAFIGLVAVLLLLRRDIATLAGFSLLATGMPLVDAGLVADAGGSAALVGRHLGIAVYLAVTGILLLRRSAASSRIGSPSADAG